MAASGLGSGATPSVMSQMKQGIVNGVLHLARVTRRRKWKEVPRSELVPPTKWNIHIGDTVQLRSGKDKGKQGLVKHIFYDRNKLLVDGCNMTFRHARPTEMSKGSLYKAPSPVHYSAVSLLDPKTKKPTRIKIKYTEDRQKFRVAKSGEVIPFPTKQDFEIPPYTYPIGYRSTRAERDTKPFNWVLTTLDTPPELVTKVTYNQSDVDSNTFTDTDRARPLVKRETKSSKYRELRLERKAAKLAAKELAQGLVTPPSAKATTAAPATQ